MVATDWPIVPAPGDYDDGEYGGMKIGRRNRSTREKPVPVPLCPPQIPLDQTRDRTRAAAMGSQRLSASAMARPAYRDNFTLLQRQVKFYTYKAMALPSLMYCSETWTRRFEAAEMRCLCYVACRHVGQYGTMKER
jgi:hypothetical protein